jgi:WD40 repeat protein
MSIAGSHTDYFECVRVMRSYRISLTGFSFSAHLFCRRNVKPQSRVQVHESAEDRCHFSLYPNQISERRKMKLDDEVVRNMAVAKLFRENTGRINSIDYSPDGLNMISSSDDDSVIIYDCQTGTKKRSVGLFFVAGYR